MSSVLLFPSASAASKRGGASPNAWGGRPRIDKVNLTGPSEIDGIVFDVPSNYTPERLIWLESLKDALFNYRDWGFGRNGTSASEWWFSCEYLFHVRSYLPQSWQSGRVLREVAVDEATGKRTNRVVHLDDETLMFMCLDQHWRYFDFNMSLESFCNRLKAERRNLIEQNWEQVRAYLRLDRTFAECAETLTCPSSPDELTNLLYAPRVGSLALAA